MFMLFHSLSEISESHNWSEKNIILCSKVLRFNLSSFQLDIFSFLIILGIFCLMSSIVFFYFLTTVVDDYINTMKKTFLFSFKC